MALTPLESPFKRKRADQPAFDVIRPVQKYPKAVIGHTLQCCHFYYRLKYQVDQKTTVKFLG